MNEDRKILTDFILKVYPMPLNEAEKIADRFTACSFEKGDYLLRSGKANNVYHFMIEGYARAYTYDLDGNDVTTAFYGPQQIVCELFSFFKRIPSQENIQALTPMTTWQLTFDELQDVFHSQLLFREFGRMVLINAYAGLKTRMLSMIQQTAEERYAMLLKMNPGIFQHAPLKQIAPFLGITDTSLSRIRKEFAKTNTTG